MNPPNKKPAGATAGVTGGLVTTSIEIHSTTSPPLAIPPEGTAFLALLLAAHLHGGDVSGALRQMTDADLDRLPVDLAWAEWCSSYLLEAEGLPAPDTPSFWLARVTPGIAAEKARRRRPAIPKRGGPLSRLKASVDLVEVAGRYTTLTPAGPGKWRGLCPMHSERTASFYVYGNTQQWRCYGACATRGDVVDLLRARGDLPPPQRRRNPRRTPRGKAHHPRRYLPTVTVQAPQ